MKLRFLGFANPLIFCFLFYIYIYIYIYINLTLLCKGIHTDTLCSEEATENAYYIYWKSIRWAYHRNGILLLKRLKVRQPLQLVQAQYKSKNHGDEEAQTPIIRYCHSSK